MPKLKSQTNDGSFSAEVPFLYIGADYYIERSAYENAMGKALAEIERLSDCLKDSRNEGDMKICEMQSHIDCLKAELEEVQTDKLELPSEPIKVAEMLIYATDSFKNLIGKEQEYKVYDKSELRQIAEHLLIYVNDSEDSCGGHCLRGGVD